METPKKLLFTNEIAEASKIEDLRFIFQESEERNKSLNDRAEKLYQNTVAILGGTIAALSAVAYKIMDIKAEFNAKCVSLWLVLLLLIYVCNVLRDNINMKEYFGVGAYPADLIDNDFYTDLGDKQPEWYLLQRRIRDNEARINENRILNVNRAQAIRKAISWLYWIPGIFIIIHLLFLFLLPSSFRDLSSLTFSLVEFPLSRVLSVVESFEA